VAARYASLVESREVVQEHRRLSGHLGILREPTTALSEASRTMAFCLLQSFEAFLRVTSTFYVTQPYVVSSVHGFPWVSAATRNCM
jgi:hypothetical protein